MGKLEYIKKRKEEEKDDEREQKPSDIYDIVHRLTQVHPLQENQYTLSENHPLAEYPNEVAQFIVKEHLLSIQAYDYIHDKKEARRVRDFMKSEMEAYAIIHRNKKSNPILMGIIKRLTEEDVPEPDRPAGIVGGFKKLLGIGPKEENKKNN